LSKNNITLYNGTALTMNDQNEIIRHAVVEIREGIINSIKSDPNFKPTEFPEAHAIDVRGNLILPGLVNCHTHVPMSLLRGIAEEMPLARWLFEGIFPFEKKWGDQTFVYEGALVSCIEMIRTGTTLFNDMYYFEDRVAQAVQEAGLRAVCGQTLIERDDVFEPAAKLLDEFDQYLDRVKKYDRVTPAIAPHSVYSVSTALFEKLMVYSEKNNLKIHVHLSETQDEVDQCVKKYGATPTEYLDQLGFWGHHVMAAHATCLTDRDIEILGRRKVRISHNPESNLKLGTQICPVVKLKSAGAVVGLGTDGSASNNNLDLFQEADFAAKLQVYREGVGKLKAKDVVRMLTIEGARVLGLDSSTGSLETGKWGDAIVIDINNAHSLPLYDPFAHVVYSATGQDVIHSVVGGTLLMENRVLKTLNEAKILENAVRWSEKIFPGTHYSPHSKY
jgi:5-methylthioadenosine/S-adenosylhomocysteine deaminase